MDYYRLGQKRALLMTGMSKQANAIVPLKAITGEGGRSLARTGMISTPAIGGGLIGAGLGAANAGEGNRLQGAALGGLLGTAGGALGGAAGLRHGDKKFLRAIENSAAPEREMTEALRYFTGSADDAVPAGNEILQAMQRTPEYTALGATTGAGAGAYLGGKAGEGLKEEPPPPQVDPYLEYLLLQQRMMNQ